MKIAFVYDAVYPWVKGGAEKRIYELGRRLAERGEEVHVYGVKWWEGADRMDCKGMVLHGVCRPMELYSGGRRSISEAVVFSIRLLPYLFREKFDVIDVSAFPYFSCFTAKLASVLRGTPMVVTWLEVWREYWYEYLGWPGFFGEVVEHLASKLAPESIAISSLTGKNLEMLGVKGQNIHTVPVGIDLRRISDIQPSTEGCDIIFAGRLIKEKNVDVLLEAVDRIREALPEVKCHIIGGGPEKKRLAAFAAERQLLDNVRFFEFMEYDEMIARIKSSKLLALPSSREGFGIVAIEAFACGVPVVTVKSKLNAASELVDEDTGLAVDLDAKELGEAIRILIEDGALREKMSASALDKAQKYDWDKIVKQLKCLYEEVTGAQG